MQQQPTITNAQPRLARNSRLRRILKNRQYYYLLIPALVWFAIFSYGPLYGLQIAFKNFNGALGIWGSKWVGLRHFNDFFSSYYFWPLFRNTFMISIYSLIAGIPFPIGIALLLNELKSQKYKKIIQTVTYAPHFISMVVLVGMVIIVLSPSTGIVNRAIVALGGDAQYFMINPRAFRHIYVWSGIWQNAGWSSIIYLAALSGVDPGLHEAAVIDGASRLQRMRYINIPTIMPTFTILLIMNAGHLLSVGFEKAFLLQNGLNMETSDIISTYIYRRGLINADYSFSSAVGLFNNVINFVMLITVNAIARKTSETSLF